MNKLKLGKKKILGFVTAGAIVVTMAGSYAVWDQLNADVTATLTLDKPVTTSLTMGDFSGGERNLGNINSYTSVATYKVADVPDGTNVEVKITPEIKAGETVLTEYFNIEIKKGENSLTSDASTQVSTDSAVTVGTDNTYNVVVTPKEDTNNTEWGVNENVIKAAKGESGEVTVTLESELSEKTVTP